MALEILQSLSASSDIALGGSSTDPAKGPRVRVTIGDTLMIKLEGEDGIGNSSQSHISW